MEPRAREQACWRSTSEPPVRVAGCVQDVRRQACLTPMIVHYFHVDGVAVAEFDIFAGLWRARSKKLELATVPAGIDESGTGRLRHPKALDIEPVADAVQLEPLHRRREACAEKL